VNLSLAIHTPDVRTPPPVALLSGTFVERLGKARRLGYDGVELMVARPAELDSAWLLSQVREAGLKIPAVASGPVFMQDHLTLLADSPETMRSAAARLMELLDLAARLESPLVTVGSFRGRLAWAGGSDARARLLETLRSAAERARGLGLRVVVEPLNRYESDVVNSACQGLALVAEAGHANLGLLLDTFHMNIEEPDLEESIRLVSEAGRLWHVHLGDSNRQPPGQGHIAFAALVDVMQECGYTGWLSAELNPGSDPDAAAAATIQTMRPLINGRSS